MTAIDYAARVAKGAALLDEKRPGWERLIDLEILNIEDGSSCVTAQLSGMRNGFLSYLEGMRELGLTNGDDGTYVSHGFNAEGFEGVTPPEAYGELNKLWKNLITERLSAGSTDG